MKKNYAKLLFFVLLIFVLFSCSNDNSAILSQDDVRHSKLEYPDAYDSVYVVKSIEDLFDVFKIEPVEKVKQSKLKSDIIYQTAYGYSTISSGSKYKTMFSSTVASRLGVSSGTVYLCYVKTVTKTVPLNGQSFFLNESSNCGYLLNSTGSVNFTSIGYATTPGTNSITLTTYIFNVYSTLSGSLINKDCPRSPSNLEWNYILY